MTVYNVVRTEQISDDKIKTSVKSFTSKDKAVQSILDDYKNEWFAMVDNYKQDITRFEITKVVVEKNNRLYTKEFGCDNNWEIFECELI